jgi:hypothetical protein
MTRSDHEYGKRVLAPLYPTPPIDPLIAAEEKARFLLQAENLLQGFTPGSDTMEKQQDLEMSMPSLRKRPMHLLKGLVAVVVALIVLVGSSLTVYAAQDSLPGESLYPLKAISEDIRLSLTRSPQTRLDMTLDYTNRRVDEITHLLASGKSLPAQAANRFQGELESALQLAAQMEDAQMQNALWKIKSHAESQGITIEALIDHLPVQAEPAIMHLQERLREQVKLSALGENNPKTFRLKVSERQHRHSGFQNPTPTNNDPISTPANDSTTPIPMNDGDDHGNGMGQPTRAPGHDDTSSGQGKSTPWNGNHGPVPSHTPKP